MIFASDYANDATQVQRQQNRHPFILYNYYCAKYIAPSRILL